MKKPSSFNRQSFYEDVFEVVKLIPEGRVTSYGAIAKYLGSGKSARMVGYALNQSVLEKGIPAHRVVNRNGELTGRHHFPPERSMQSCLEKEGIEVTAYKIVDYKKHFWDPSQELL
ncbi:MAG: MGMT family protein [Bacteroidota bacterium]